jgi:hypothetical protein
MSSVNPPLAGVSGSGLSTLPATITAPTGGSWQIYGAVG